MVRLGLGAVLSLALAGLLGAARPAQTASVENTSAEPVVAVVVNARNPAARLSPAEVRRIFLLRQRFWKSGARVEPVNLPAASRVRDAFSRSVLGRPARDFADYWNDLYFHGTEPPPVLESERAVLLFVARAPNAIGYVSPAALRDPGAADGIRVVLEVER